MKNNLNEKEQVIAKFMDEMLPFYQDKIKSHATTLTFSSIESLNRFVMEIDNSFCVSFLLSCILRSMIFMDEPNRENYITDILTHITKEILSLYNDSLHDKEKMN